MVISREVSRTQPLPAATFTDIYNNSSIGLGSFRFLNPNVPVRMYVMLKVTFTVCSDIKYHLSENIAANLVPMNILVPMNKIIVNI